MPFFDGLCIVRAMGVYVTSYVYARL